MAKSEDTIEVKMSEPKPHARIELGKKMKMPKLKMGEHVKVTIHGKLNSFTDDEYSRCFSIEISDIETDRGMAGDIKDITESRKMKKEKEEEEEE